jgi:competence protein ComEC
MASVHTVDAIIPAKLWSPSDTDLSLVRMVHATDVGPGGLRYIAVDRACVASDDDGPTSPKLEHGRAYQLDAQQLAAAVKDVPMGDGSRRVPVVTLENLDSCLRRDAEAENELRDSIQSQLKNAVPVGNDTEENSGGASGPPRGQPSVLLQVRCVGQGETIWVESHAGRAWLIDAYFWKRASYDRFLHFARRRLPDSRLDRLVISHFHYDHLRYAAQVVVDLNPREVLVPDTLPHPTGTVRNLVNLCSDRGILRRLQQPERYVLAGTELRVLRTSDFAGSFVVGSDPNLHALVTCVQVGSSFALLPADIPGRMLRELAASPLVAPSLASAQKRIYKVAHHCSRSGIDGEFLRIFRPTSAVTSCGFGNRFGHPHDPPWRDITAAVQASEPGAEHLVTCYDGDANYVLD